MATIHERLLKAEHDAWHANYVASVNKANLEYVAMLDYPEMLEEEEEEIYE